MKYNPAAQSHQKLEDLFVGADRLRILNDIVERATAAATSEQRNHSLLVGRRGAGKSHLTAVAYYRIGEIAETESLRLQRSWLPEDPLTIHNYTEFLRQIARALLRSRAQEEQPFRDTDESEMEAWLDHEATTAGTIVVFTENFDQVLELIDELGQQKLRHYLQTSGSLLLVATTTTLSRELTGQSSPFFGFFTTSNLEQFDVDTASEMLAAIAEGSGDSETAEFIRSETGLARLRAIQHLAGGQPRMWATLGQTLTKDDLDELVGVLLTQFDELTPYYQEQIARLSPLQRRVVARLAQTDRPMTVEMLADDLESSSQTISKAVHTLYKSKRWIQPCETRLTGFGDGRRTYYELAEPLARLIFQIKESRGEPLELVIDFIKLWFEPEEIYSLSQIVDGQINDYIERAKQGDRIASTVRELHGFSVRPDYSELEELERLDEALKALSQGDPEPMLKLPSAVRRAAEDRIGPDASSQEAIGATRAFVHCVAFQRLAYSPNRRVTRWFNEAPYIANAEQFGLILLPIWASMTWDFETAQAAIQDIARVLGSDHQYVFMSRKQLAISYAHAGEIKKASSLFEELASNYEQLLGLENMESKMIASAISSLRGVKGKAVLGSRDA